MTMQDELDELALLINQSKQATQVANEAREAFEAEFAAMFSEEKRLKLLVEQKKDGLRRRYENQFFDSGERPSESGVTMAMVETVEITNHDKAVQFLAEHAPQLLDIKGVQQLKSWINERLLLVRTSPTTWDCIVELKDQHSARPAPFRIVRKPSIRLEEKVIVTDYDQRLYEGQNGTIQKED